MADLSKLLDNADQMAFRADQTVASVRQGVKAQAAISARQTMGEAAMLLLSLHNPATLKPEVRTALRMLATWV